MSAGPVPLGFPRRQRHSPAGPSLVERQRQREAARRRLLDQPEPVDVDEAADEDVDER